MKERLNKQHMTLVFGIICAVGLLAVGISYAWWRLSFVQDKANTAVSKCLKLELANQSNEINLTNMYPISDEEGRALTPFTFTLKNTCSMSAKYTLNLEMLEGTTLNSNYLAVLVNNKDIKLLSSYNTATTVVKGSTESRTLDTGTLAPNGSKDYSISLWMDKSVTLSDDSQNKTFKSKVVIDAVATETAMDKIIASVDTTGKCPTINSDGTVNVTSAEATDGYVCSAEDTYGTSYYYRGNVTNNYVKFGIWSSDTPTLFVDRFGIQYDSLEDCTNSGGGTCTELAHAGKDMYWRIVRLNGDGTLRVIYDGTSAHANGESSSDRQIGTSEFNSNYDDNMYVGYMYGEKDKIFEDTSQYDTTSWANTSSYYVAKEYIIDENTKELKLKDPVAVLTADLTTDYIGYYSYNSTYNYYSNNIIYQITSITSGDTSATVGYKRIYYGTSSKEVAQTNANSSTIKIYLDTWYENNIKGTENEQYLADDIFCNDRSISSNILDGYSNNGYGLEKTAYRWYDFSDSSYNNKMMLTCSQQNDAFTVSDTTNGNGSLTYSVGLLSTDEIVLAGGWSTSNNGYYLYSGKNWWASSPGYFDGSNAIGHFVDSDGSAYYAYYVSNYNWVRPVLNLSPEVLNNGDGTMNDPYRP